MSHSLCCGEKMIMSNSFLKQVRLDPGKLCDKETMAAYMKQEMELPEWFGGNLDALADVLSEITQETVFEVEVSTMGDFTSGEYPGRVLKVISGAAKENPHLHLYLTDSDWM